MKDDRAPVAGGEGAPQDAATLAALLRVYADVELHGRLRALLREAVALTGAARGFVVAPDEEGTGVVLTPDAETDRGEPPFPARGLDELPAWGEAERRYPADGPFPEVGPVVAFAVPTAHAPVALLLLPDAPPLSEQARAAVRRLLRLAAGAVGQAMQVRAVRALVIQDDTAACYNRRHFNTFLQEELARATRFRAPLSLIFFDMDNLKQVNNLLGHSMGSRTLWEVSSRVRGKIRKFDKLFRFGGDEFCIVLPETEWHGALEVAERVREAIAGVNFLVAETPGGEGIRMTASFGIASFPLHARSKEELIQRADRAMQQVKSGPKNSIAVAELAGEPRAGG